MHCTITETETRVMDITQEADALVNGDRQKDYGRPSENFQDIADIWSVILKTPVTAEQVALCMIGLKLARLKHNPQHRDSQTDICGYAKCLRMLGE